MSLWHAHNPRVGGSSPSSATKSLERPEAETLGSFWFLGEGQSVETMADIGNRLIFLFQLDPKWVSIQSVFKKLSRHGHRAALGAFENEGAFKLCEAIFGHFRQGPGKAGFSYDT